MIIFVYMAQRQPDVFKCALQQNKYIQLTIMTNTAFKFGRAEALRLNWTLLFSCYESSR